MQQAGTNGTTAPMVSVVVTTYQHAPFIEECIQSILMQQTNFPVEILIGEDESTDGTREICQRLATQYPDRIRLFLRERKDVMYIDGRATGRANLLHLLNRSKGRYIALCEGDDYWTDPLKLQDQVDVLENEPRLSGCFANAFNELNGVRTDYYNGIAKPAHDCKLEYAVGYLCMPTCTLVYRKDLIRHSDPIFLRSPVADSLILLLLAMQGPLRFIDRNVAVRRIHPGGIYSMQSQKHKSQVSIAFNKITEDLLEGRFEDVTGKRFSYAYMALWQIAVDENDHKTARRYWWKLFCNRQHTNWSPRMYTGTFLRSWFPAATKTLSKMAGKH